VGGTGGGARVQTRPVTYQQPLGPDEQEYRTEQATPDVAPGGDPLEPEESHPAAGSPPWLVLGLVLLAVFVGLIVLALAVPLAR
jgi:hypothetical protein